MSAPVYHNWFQRAVSHILQYGIGGPIIAEVSGALEVFQSDGLTPTNMRGADPLAAADFATKNYVDSLPAGSGSQTKFFSVGFADVPSDVFSATNVPAGALILAAYVNVTTAFDGGAGLRLGRSVDGNLLFAAGEIDLTIVGLQGGPFMTDWPAAEPVRAVLTAGAGPFTTGAADIRVDYVLPES